MANNQRFTLTFDANLNVSQMKGALSQISGQMSKLQLPPNITKNLTTGISNLEKELRNFEVLASKDITNKTDFKALEKSAEKISSLYRNLQIQVRDIANTSDAKKLFPPDVTNNIKKAVSAIEKYERTMADASKQAINLQKRINSWTAKATIASEDKKVAQGNLSAIQDAAKLKQIFKRVGSDISAIGDPKAIDAAIASLDELIKKAEDYNNKVQNEKNSRGKDYADSTKARAQAQLDALKQLKTAYDGEASSLKTAMDALDKATKERDKATKTIRELNVQLQNANAVKGQAQQSAVTQLFQDLSQLNGIDLSKYEQTLDGARQAISDYEHQVAEGVRDAADVVVQSMDKSESAFEKNRQEIQETARSWNDFEDRMREVDSLKSRIQYFFGLNNAIELFKRTIRSAFNTVKELDAAMTETAVVTDFTVADMWAQLPDYTKRANDLGVTTKAAYEAATLYYQQGLKTNEVTAMSNETLKMARIAGLDAAVATDRMTNAIRGFNMEINEMNAQRIDDVYSKLAAISASNVDEISTAMTKVASLANNANMEFETTSAFLAQIIETTRESAETAGTALKTVVARFSEVKKLVSEDQLKGQDEEGQLIDVNKVSEALRTAGVDLNKYFLGEVGLDDIFMELASKWDSLTTLQQRYIATQAAGSRQQSRFIALMSDYGRMQELVGEAYNANGAAAEQFSKTQDSLQSKLARLKNAWNEFAMGLANNSLIKLGVDALTHILNIVNGLTSGFEKLLGPSGSFIDGLTKIALLIGGLKVGKGLLAGSLSSIIGKGSFGKAAASAMGVEPGKGAFGTLGKGFISPFKNIGASFSLFKETDLAKNIWGGAKGLGGKVLGKVSGLGPGLGLGLETGALEGVVGLTTAIGGIAAAAGVAYLAIKKLYDLSPTGQVKIAEKYADTIRKVSEEAKKTQNSLKDAQTKYKEYSQAISDSSNVQDHSKAIQDRNEYLTSLLEQDASFAKYIQSEVKNGEFVLTINEDVFANAITKAEEAVQKLKVNDLLAQANLAAQKADLAWAKKDEADNLYDEAGNVVATRETTAGKQFAVQAQASEFESKQLAKQAAVEMLGGANLGDELTSVLAESYASTFNADKMQKQTTKMTGWLGAFFNWGENSKRYQELYGVGSQKGISLRDRAKAINAAEYTESQQNALNELTEALQSQNGEKYEDVLRVYAGDFSKFASLINKGDLNLQLDKEALEKVATAYDIPIEELTQQIQNYAQTERERQLQTRDTGYYSLAKSGASKLDIARYLTLDNFEDTELISGLAQKFESSGVGGEIAHSILDQIESGTFEDSTLQKWLQDLNFDNPIAGAKALHDGLQSVNPQVRELAEAIQADDEAMSQFSASAQLSYLMTSESAEQLNESLGDFIEENGEINSANIRELAASNADLNSLLETGAFTAKALAIALNGIETGKIQFYDLTDSIIVALNAMDDLDGIVANTIEDLNNFDPGYDENDITGFINKAYENATENFNKGAYGNNQMANYMREIFGTFTPEEGQDYSESYKTWLQGNISWLEANKENMYSAWSDVAAAAEQGAQLAGASIKNTGSEIILETNGATTQELIQALQENFNYTETQARMLIADFKNYSADFAHELAQNDLPSAIEAWVGDKLKTGQVINTTEKELDTLATVLGVGRDEVEKEISKTLNIKRKGKINIIDTDTMLKDVENLKDVMRSMGHTIGADDIFNFEALRSGLSELGLVDKFNEELNAVVGEATTFQANINGKLVEITREAGQDAASAYAEALEAETQKQFGANFFAGIIEAAAANNINIEPVDIPIDVDTEELKSELSVAISQLNSIESKKPNVKLGIDSSINTTISRLQQILNLLNQVNNTTTSPTVNKPNAGGKAPPGGRRARTGGIVKSSASGNHILHPGISLTGEEGPEVVWNKEQGYAYITGNEGPEYQNLQPGDRVFNAEETKKILKRSKKNDAFPSFASGKYPSYASAYDKAAKSGAGTGSSSKTSAKTTTNSEKTSDEWKNELDWLYNLMEDIAESERTQEKLATKHERYLKDATKTGKDLYNITKQQMQNLNQQYAYQKQALSGREKEMQEQINQSGYTDYVWWNNNDRTIEINWDKIEGLQDKDTYDKVSELVSKAEDIQSKIDAAEDALRDIEDQMKELQERYVQEYVDFEKRVLEAVVNKYQEQIDNLSELNDILNDSNTNILNSIREEVDLQRQIRDNTDTENQIKDMEARLAYLRRDTTGANQTEILQLEKQLEDERQDYSDTLVDQSIDRLSKDNEAAAEQREHQIELLTAQLDYWQKSGELWEEVHNLMKDGISPEGWIRFDSDLMAYLKSTEEFRSMSQVQQEQWIKELENVIAEVNAYTLNKEHPVWDDQSNYMQTMQDLLKQRGTQAFSEPAYQEASASRIEKRMAQGASKEAAIAEQKVNETLYLNNVTWDNNTDYKYEMLKIIAKKGAAALSDPLYLQYAAARQKKAVDKKVQTSWEAQQAQAEVNALANTEGQLLIQQGLKKGLSGSALSKFLGFKFAKGGLNTTTGLAWLDGTFSEPEYVLNARQTEAFLRLSEVLPSMFGNTNGSTITNGNVYLELTMNVGEIGSDYDVDRVVDRVKQDIYDASAYRNVNVISSIR